MPMQLNGGFGSQPEIPEADVDTVPEIPSVQAMIAQAKKSNGMSKEAAGLDWGEDLAAITQLAGPILAIMGIPAGAALGGAVGASGAMSATGVKTSANIGGGS